MGDNAEFIVFEDKGVVVCKLWGCERLAIEEISKHIDYILSDVSLYLINEVYTGVCKCELSDEFDVEYGKKIALAKAKDKCKEAVDEMIMYFIQSTRINLFRLELEKHTRIG